MTKLDSPILSFTCLCLDLALVEGVNSRQVSIATNNMVKPKPYSASPKQQNSVSCLITQCGRGPTCSTDQLLSVVLAQFWTAGSALLLVGVQQARFGATLLDLSPLKHLFLVYVDTWHKPRKYTWIPEVDFCCSEINLKLSTAFCTFASQTCFCNNSTIVIGRVWGIISIGYWTYIWIFYL